MSPRLIRRPVPPTSNGFTLLEVCVAMAILGVLTAITVPAVFNARETTRRVQCASNLRQHLVAYHNYLEVHHEFPGSGRVNGILPFIEVPLPIYDSAGKLLSKPGPVPLFVCPSDPFATHWFTIGRSYWPNMGVTHHAQNGLYRNAERKGAVRPADVTDGLSATSALSERLVEPDSQADTTDEAFWHHRLIRLTPNFVPDMDQFADECEQHSFNPGITFYQTASYNHVQTPNRKSCTNGPRAKPEASEWMAATAVSLHRGGVNVAMADGAVRFVADSVDRQVWRAMGSRNGNEALSLPEP
jgi:prepilin-type N-terminal cleavage/methylation domain-containing protein/prepilin-type processing-associated H-X9-DG protein